MMKMNDFHKDEIKKLMQEHTKTAITKEVDSPYAKYNSRGQLMCIVCGTYVKSKIIWQAHVKKRSHIENLARLKEKQEKISNLPYKKSASQINGAEKRLLCATDEKSEGPHKKQCIDKPKGILKNLRSYDSSESDDEDMKNCVPEDVKPFSTTAIKSEIPSDFFDNNVSDSLPKLQSNTASKTDTSAAASKPSTSELLPEGFFDDPVADAKARNVEYRDKEAEEWSSFMKEVLAAEMVSEQIIAEDKEEAALETQIEQTNEQIKCLERIVELDKAKKTQLQDKTVNASCGDSGDSSDEEFSPVIWRTKNSLI